MIAGKLHQVFSKSEPFIQQRAAYEFCIDTVTFNTRSRHGNVYALICRDMGTGWYAPIVFLERRSDSARFFETMVKTLRRDPRYNEHDHPIIQVLRARPSGRIHGSGMERHVQQTWDPLSDHSIRRQERVSPRRGGGKTYRASGAGDAPRDAMPAVVLGRSCIVREIHSKPGATQPRHMLAGRRHGQARGEADVGHHIKIVMREIAGPMQHFRITGTHVHGWDRQ